jgi:GT2 family glycosyltransferase
MSPPLVYTVILNWQRPDDTMACIRSIQSCEDYKNLRLLVVDNGSEDDSHQRIAAACPEVELLSLPKNLGFAGGNNEGIRYALSHKAEFVFLLNNDTIIRKDVISMLLSALRGESEWSISVPKIYYYDEPNRIWAAGARWRRFPPRVTMIGFGKRDAPQYNDSRELAYATGCAMMVSHAVFKDIGGFDPLFVNYQEDYDFCYRARQAGHRLLYVPQAVIMHKVSRSLGEDAPIRWYYLGRNTVLFYRPGERFSWASLLAFLGWVLLRELISGNGSRLPAFLHGVRDGVTACQQLEAEQC